MSPSIFKVIGLLVVVVLLASFAAVFTSTRAQAAGPLAYIQLGELTRLSRFTMTAGETQQIQVTGQAGVPTSAKAVLLDVTAADGTAANTYLTLWPGGTRPDVKMVNAPAGTKMSNTALVELSASGAVQIYNYAGSVTVTVNVQGYFVLDDGATGGGYRDISPVQRLFDTGTAGQIPAGGTVDVKITGVQDVPSGSTAVLVNLIAVDPTEPGSVGIYTRGTTPTSFAGPVYWGNGDQVAQAVLVKPDPSGYGTIKNYQTTGSIRVKLDVQGYFVEPSTDGELLTTLSAPILAPSQMLAAGELRTIQVGGVNGVPTEGISSIFANVIVVDPSTTNGLRVWSQHDPEPTHNNVTYQRYLKRDSFVATRISDDGTLNIRNMASVPVGVRVEIQGWFDGKPGPAIDPTPLPNPVTPSPEPDPTSDPNDPTVVSGQFLNPDGTAAAGLSVSLYPEPPDFDTPPSVPTTLAPLAQATTASDGTWSATLPRNLPTELESRAAENSGVLNIEAVAAGSAADGRPFIGSRMVRAGTPVSGQLSEAAIHARASQAGAARLHPLKGDSELGTPPTLEETSDDEFESFSGDTEELAPPVEWKSYSANSLVPQEMNPNFAGGVDYSNAAVRPDPGDYGILVDPSANLSSLSHYELAGGQQCSYSGEVHVYHIDYPYRYVRMLEGHAYWNTKHSVAYSRVSNAVLGGGVSGNLGDSWKVSGSYSIANAFDSSTGWDAGVWPSYDARVAKISVKFSHTRVYRCEYDYHADVVREFYVRDRMVPVKVARQGSDPWLKHNNIEHLERDGVYGFAAANDIYELARGTFFCKDRAKYKTYEAATSVEGAKISAFFYASYETGHLRRQCAHAGTSTSRKHWLFTGPGSTQTF
ncbi:hypothetical protein ABN034_33435 [Actinopolymorpha sp. B11F2]|uniref:hypothetical protein n=1 Tax=Actinopolymorpha sp. B11F2 TaxID=3160862 RepID=UPI0032E4806B